MADTGTVDVEAEMRALCDKLGLEYNMVKSMFSTPVAITATVYNKNQDGMKYILEETGEVATSELTFQVTT